VAREVKRLEGEEQAAAVQTQRAVAARQEGLEVGGLKVASAQEAVASTNSHWASWQLS
jgi:hypothetical protein